MQYIFRSGVTSEFHWWWFLVCCNHCPHSKLLTLTYVCPLAHNKPLIPLSTNNNHNKRKQMLMAIHIKQCFFFWLLELIPIVILILLEIRIFVTINSASPLLTLEQHCCYSFHTWYWSSTFGTNLQKKKKKTRHYSMPKKNVQNLEKMYARYQNYKWSWNRCGDWV